MIPTVSASLYTAEEGHTVVLGKGTEPGIQEGKGTFNICEGINTLRPGKETPANL